MKLLNKSLKSNLIPIFLGISEDEHHYCLVKKEAEKFSVFWQKKPHDFIQFIQKIISSNIFNKTKNHFIDQFRLIRPVPHEYIWRKTVFLPKTLNEIQLHQQVIHILKNEQPLPIESLNIDYQRYSNSSNNLSKIIVYALRKSYTNNLYQYPCVLDCELHCYMRAIIHFKDNQVIDKSPCFSFKQKIIQFAETELQFSQVSPNNCVHIHDIPISEPNIYSDTEKHLYLLALGASLWNGKALI